MPLLTRFTKPLTLGFAVVTVGLSVFSGDVLRSVVVAAIVISHVTVGGALLDRMGQTSTYGRFERIPLDFVVGSSVVIAAVFLSGEIIGWSTAIIAYTVMSVLVLAVRIAAELRAASRSHPDFRWLCALFVVTLMFLSRDYRWAIGALPGALVILLATKLARNRRLAVPLLVLGAVAMAWAFERRGPLWWFITDDNQLFTSIVTAVARFSPTDQLGPLGTLGIQYHIGTYVYAAIFELWAQAPPYVILERFFPLLFAGATAGISLAVVRHFRHVGPWAAVVAMFVVSRVFGYSVHSLSFVHGVLVVIAIGSLLAERERPFSRSVSIAVYVALGLMAAVIKASNIPIVAVLATVTLVVVSWTSRRIVGHEVLRTATIIGVMGVYGIMFLVGDRSTRQINSFVWFGYARE